MSESRLASRLGGVNESATLKLNAMVTELKKAGKDVVNLTAGEPDFAVAPSVKAAVINAVEQNQSKYTAASGILELRLAVANKTNLQQKKLANPWTASDVVITNGGKQALFNAFLAVLNEGDEVLMTSPYWLSYPDMVKICGGVPKVIQTTLEQNYKMTPAQLQSAMSNKTKMIILNSPSNPTGATYSAQQFGALAQVIKQSKNGQNIVVISDEIYDEIVFDQTQGFCSFLNACPELQAQTITVNGLSKSAAMTGWRIGWSVANAHWTKAMAILQGQSTSGINALAQWASVEALKLDRQYFNAHLEVYRKRRDLALEILKKTGKIKEFAPEGAFYVFVDISGVSDKIKGAQEFAEKLLSEAQVAVVAGEPFGAPQAIRISFATSEDQITKGLQRMVDWVESL